MSESEQTHWQFLANLLGAKPKDEPATESAPPDNPIEQAEGMVSPTGSADGQPTNTPAPGDHPERPQTDSPASARKDAETKKGKDKKPNRTSWGAVLRAVGIDPPEAIDDVPEADHEETTSAASDIGRKPELTDDTRHTAPVAEPQETSGRGRRTESDRGSRGGGRKRHESAGRKRDDGAGRGNRHDSSSTSDRDSVSAGEDAIVGGEASGTESRSTEREGRRRGRRGRRGRGRNESDSPKEADASTARLPADADPPRSRENKDGSTDEDANKGRRRRRRSRRPRDADRTETPSRSADLAEDDDLNDPLSVDSIDAVNDSVSFDASAEETASDSDDQPRPRRRRRGRRKRSGKRDASNEATESLAPSDEFFDDATTEALDDNDTRAREHERDEGDTRSGRRRSRSRSSSDADDRGARRAASDDYSVQTASERDANGRKVRVPSWQDAVNGMISRNLANRKRSGGGRQQRSRGGGGSRRSGPRN